MQHRSWMIALIALFILPVPAWQAGAASGPAAVEAPVCGSSIVQLGQDAEGLEPIALEPGQPQAVCIETIDPDDPCIQDCLWRQARCSAHCYSSCGTQSCIESCDDDCFRNAIRCEQDCGYCCDDHPYCL